MRKPNAVIILGVALVGCSQADEANQRLAEQVQQCLKRADQEKPVSIPVRIVLDDDGSVKLIEVKATDADQSLYDAQDAVMRAVQTCAPYEVGRAGEFEIVSSY